MTNYVKIVPKSKSQQEQQELEKQLVLPENTNNLTQLSFNPIHQQPSLPNLFSETQEPLEELQVAFNESFATTTHNSNQSFSSMC